MSKNKFKQTEIGEIPEDWKVSSTSSVVEIISGGTPKTSVKDYWNGHIPWLSVVDFNTDQKRVHETEKSITEHGLKNSSTNVLRKGMLIISARGTVGAIAQLGKDMAFNQSCYGLDAKNEISSNDFLYYALKSRIDSIRQKSHGSVFSTITRNTFDDIYLPVPPVREQQQIASILSSLDDKIELNRRMNKTLEEIGKALFKRWFVDFEFPNENGEPYKSSGGEMVESELGEIPKGWEIKTLPEVADIQKGISYKGNDLSESSDTALVGLKCIERGGGFRKDGFKFYDGAYKDEHVLKPGDLIVAMTDLTQAADVIGKPAIVPIIPQIETLVASLDLSIIKPKEDGFDEYYLYLLLSRQESQDFLYGYTNGSTVLHLSVKGLKEFKLLLPEDSILAEFQKILQPIRKKLKSLDAETSYLPLLRDSLLPRLMSGKIRVN